MKKNANNKISPVTASRGNGRKIKNDVIFIAAILILAALAALALFVFRSEGDFVTVTVDGRLFGEYSLSENRRVEINQGENYNILVIEDGYVSIETASCPDGICTAHRPISRDGESIVCLPNWVVVTVLATREDAPDIVAEGWMI